MSLPPPPRVTEGANPLTAALDTASPSEFLRLLQSCDAQLFTGSHGLPSLYSPSTLEAATACTLAVAAALAHPRGRIIFSGCGTSGRLAHLLARLYNLSWARICRAQQPSQQPPLQRFHYLLAGGDAALLVPAESIEDQQQAGAGDLGAWVVKEGVGASDPTVLIGISVGLSATYVASMLAAALQQGPAWSAVAMGFNALEAVKAVKVPGSAVSFYSVLALMQEQQQLILGQNTASAPPTRCCVLINPVVGEEAVAGSSRMKGGSVTLLLCAAMCETALQLHLEQAQAQAQAQHSQSTTALLLRRSFQQAQGSVETLYERGCSALEGILVSASSALCAPPPPPPSPPPPEALQPLTPLFTPSASTAGGRLIYLGRSHAGILGLVDASEATDTYGSRFNDVRAFMAGGWGAMSVVKGGATDDPIVPPELQRRSAAVAAAAAAAGGAGVERASPSLHSFSQHFLPTLGPLDCVVVLSLPDVDAEELEEEGAPSSPSVVLQELQDLHTAAGAAAATGAQVHFVSISHPSPPPGSTSSSSSSSSTLAQASSAAASLRALCRSGLHLELSVGVPDQQLQPQVQRSQRSSCSLLALKLALNALTTGAFAAQGALLGNRMANMMLTNHKLLLRARVTVGALTGASEEESHKALLRSVYGIDTTTSAATSAGGGGGTDRLAELTSAGGGGGTDRLAELVAEEKADGGAALRHVEAAALVDKVIPVALLLLLHEQARVGAGAAVAAVEPLSVSAARAALQVKPRVRDALAMLLGSMTTTTV